MAVIRATHLVNIGGNDEKVVQQENSDTVLNTIDSSLLTVGSMLFRSGATGSDHEAFVVGTNQIVGRENGDRAKALNATEVRSIIGVDAGAQANAAANIGSGFEIFSSVNSAGEIELRKLFSLSAERFYMDDSGSRILMDSLAFPFERTVTAAPVSGDFITLFKNNSQPKLLMNLVALLQAGTIASGVSFSLKYHTSARQMSGASEMANITTTDDTGDGLGDGVYSKGDVEIPIPLLPANAYLMLRWTGNNTTSFEEFHLSLNFSVDTTL